MENDLLMIPYVAHEQAMYRADKEKRRWFFIAIILIVSLIASNLGWVIYESQFETVTETEETYSYEIEQDNENGDNNFIGRDGDINNGETKD